MSDPETYDVYAIRYGSRGGRDAAETFLMNAWSDRSHDFTADVAYYVWLITNENRTVLVDTGFDRAEMERRKQHSGGKWQPDYARSPAEGVAMLGVEPHRIQDVIVTHLHFDHAGTIDDFPEATFHLQELEMAYATGRYMRHPGLRGAYSVELLTNMIRRLFEGRVRFVSGDAEFAPGIELHLIGGHTMGIQSVRVLTKRGWVMLASDASHFYDNVYNMAPYPIVYSVGEMLEGFEKLMRLAETPGHIIPGHDPLVMERYPAPTAALDGAAVRLDVAPKT
ncbi:MAG: N-acyl homoserine lactonase family protein [Alphaproteobacteria bacterium]|jgi:glyoxylase-like metal-dependent hydrolase (beta-lactamase superfamily II)|nr:N-acyl homoserine lactonase family protein [Alphaproteobacteria bacterium]